MTLAPAGIPRLGDVTLDLPVTLFSTAVMAVATLLCGAAPMRHAGHVNLTETLNDGSRTVAGGRAYRTRSILLVVQVALAVVLLIGAGLVVRSFAALQRLDLGFDGRALLRMKVEPRGSTRPPNEWLRDLLPEIARLDDVASVGAVYLTPMELGSIGQGTWVVVEGQVQSEETASRNPMLNYLSATPGYFQAMRIPIVRGRGFSDDDRASAPRVSIISESTAAALFPAVGVTGRVQLPVGPSRRGPKYYCGQLAEAAKSWVSCWRLSQRTYVAGGRRQMTRLGASRFRQSAVPVASRWR